jgi:hypothetical protein
VRVYEKDVKVGLHTQCRPIRSKKNFSRYPMVQLPALYLNQQLFMLEVHDWAVIWRRRFTG